MHSRYGGEGNRINRKKLEKGEKVRDMREWARKGRSESKVSC